MLPIKRKTEYIVFHPLTVLADSMTEQEFVEQPIFIMRRIHMKCTIDHFQIMFFFMREIFLKSCVLFMFVKVELIVDVYSYIPNRILGKLIIFDSIVLTEGNFCRYVNLH